VPSYAAVLVPGVSVMLGEFVVLRLPLLVRFICGAASQLSAGLRTGRFWDGAGLLLTGRHVALLLISAHTWLSSTIRRVCASSEATSANGSSVSCQSTMSVPRSGE
jgi:hypothetical protein